MGIGRRNIQLRYGNIVVNSLDVWRITGKMLGVTGVFYKTSPMWNNLYFQSGGEPFVLPPRARKGVFAFSDLSDNTALRTFQDIKNDITCILWRNCTSTHTLQTDIGHMLPL